MRKRNKPKHVLKKDHWQPCIEYKHKNTGTSSCKSIRISKLQCFNSTTKCWKSVSLQTSFGLFVEIWSWFSKLVCFNWVRIEVFTSLLIEKNLWTYGKLDILMHEKNILWELTTPKYTVYIKKYIKASTSFKCMLF